MEGSYFPVSISLPPFPVTPPAQRVQFILGQESQDVEHETHPVFSEMEELIVGEDGNMEWKETARSAGYHALRPSSSNPPPSHRHPER